MRLARTSMLAAALLAPSLVVAVLTGTTINAFQLAPARHQAPLNRDLTPSLMSAETLIAMYVPSEVDALIDGGWLDYTTDPPSYFDVAQVISFYGHPGICVMGELGCHAVQEAAQRIGELALNFDRLNGARYALPALHVIVDVAQRQPQDDGSYLDRLSMAAVSEWVELAREHGYLLFLDLQVGWADTLESVQRLEPFLEEPFVHVAIDPEFATGRSRIAPGEIIGTLRSEEVNEVQNYLGLLVRRHDLPQKILVLHQFRDFMLRTPEEYEDVREVEVTIDMDGWGGDGAKLAGYELFAQASYAERSAFKLFYRWDTPDVLSPEEMVALPNPPDYVIYQ